MHQPQIALGIDVAGQRHAALRLVDAQDGAHQAALAVVVAEHREREQQARTRQLAGMVAKVALVDVQRRLTVQLVEHVVAGSRDLARRAERHPAAIAAEVELQRVAIQADRQQLIVRQTLGRQHPGLLEVGVASQSARDRHPAERGAQALDQRAAVDLHALRQQQHRAEAVAGQGRGETPPGVFRVVHADQPGHAGAQAHPLEGDRRDDEGVIAHAAVGNLAGGRTAGEDGPRRRHREWPGQRLQPARRTEGQHELRGEFPQKRQVDAGRRLAMKHALFDLHRAPP
mmetsp:Transcript_70489/g.166252  ORF Transcript_70489/g.166252 Transcript_70489/m.166252 type:complete len:286 (+) Transcript_70489:851-1708(+)